MLLSLNLTQKLIVRICQHHHLRDPTGFARGVPIIVLPRFRKGAGLSLELVATPWQFLWIGILMHILIWALREGLGLVRRLLRVKNMSFKILEMAPTFILGCLPSGLQ